MLDESRNQGKSLGTELEGGMMGTCPEWKAWARAGHKAANRRGESGVAGRQQSQAQVAVPLWWGSTCWSALSQLGDGCCVEPGLCDSWKWHKASRAGGNASLLWANHKGFGKQKWSHAVQRGRMGKRMSLKPSLWWCSSLYLKAREKIAPQRAVMSALWQLLLLLVKLCNTVPTSLGWWQELKWRASWTKTLVTWHPEGRNTDTPAWSQELSSWEIHAHRAGAVGATPVKEELGQVLCWCAFLKEALSCTCRKTVQLREACSDRLTGIAHSSCWGLHSIFAEAQLYLLSGDKHFCVSGCGKMWGTHWVHFPAL